MSDASYRFGPFTADRIAYQVLCDGKPLDLTPKLLDLFFHLLDARMPRSVTSSARRRQALRDGIFPLNRFYLNSLIHMDLQTYLSN